MNNCFHEYLPQHCQWVKCKLCGQISTIIENYPDNKLTMQIPDTPQLTPIEKAIEYYNRCKNIAIEYGSSGSVEQDIDSVINFLTGLLPYERQYLRDVAEDACDSAIVYENNSFNNVNPDNYAEWVDREEEIKKAIDKQTYLNKNHPLC